MSVFTFNIIKILILAFVSSIFAVAIAPFLIKILYKTKFWKKETRTKSITGDELKVFPSLHKEKEINIPRAGGILIGLTVLVVIFFFFILSKLTDIWWIKQLDFLSRGQTWLPLFALISASILGFVDDALQISGKGKYIGGGLSFKKRIIVVSLIGFIGGIWFYYKLGIGSVHIPLIVNFPEGIDLIIGFWYIPLFILVTIASWAGGVVDGIDGLSGGVFASIFGAFSIIAFSLGKIDLAAFCVVITGTLFAFLWFNIPPAKFYMGEVGILGLTSTMAVVAFLTDSVMVLPIIAGILVVEVLSIILQLLSKKFRKKKIWLCTPFHHHFEAIGWPSHKVTMRFWIIGVVLAIIGVAIRLLA